MLRVVHRSIPMDGQLHRLSAAQAGAVGHVVGLRGVDGTRYAMKVFGAGQSDRYEVESNAARRLRTIGVPVPEVLLAGRLDAPSVGFVLMTWLPGRRWAECVADVDYDQAQVLLADAGRLLRAIHAETGPWFGDVLRPPTTLPTAADLVAERLYRLLPLYVRVGGPHDLARRAAEFVGQRSAAIGMCSRAVLCHNDFVDGNLMVQLAATPQISGVFDFERVSWGDPMNDLAVSYIHFRYHYPDLVASLMAAYGIEFEHEQLRLQAYEALHLMDERCWISTDRPQGWQRSTAALDDRLRQLLDQ